jgi:hypothetical protein
MFSPGAEFLASYVNKNIGPLGLVGRMPLGLTGSLSGVPGIGPGGNVAPGTGRPELLGGLVGGLAGGLAGNAASGTGRPELLGGLVGGLAGNAASGSGRPELLGGLVGGLVGNLFG